jgi:hypothetical protein
MKFGKTNQYIASLPVRTLPTVASSPAPGGLSGLRCTLVWSWTSVR